MGEPIRDLQDLKNLFPDMEKFVPEKEDETQPVKDTSFTHDELSKSALYISRDRKNRGGKTVTLIEGLPDNPDATKQLLSDLKSKCATGGKMEGAVVLIQGDHLEKVREFLKKTGFRSIKQKGG